VYFQLLIERFFTVVGIFFNTGAYSGPFRHPIPFESAT
jgi:hypothetical protein